MTGKQIKLFLVDGMPGGITTAEITNWTGHLVSGPRSKLSKLLEREEAHRTGIYMLLGKDPEAIDELRVYIGEADEVRARLSEHHGPRGKDFWDRVLVVTSKDANITKAHARYLESRLIQIATQTGRASIENSTAPPVRGLPEADASDMEYFIDQMRTVLPVLGINILRGRPQESAPAQVTPEAVEPPPELFPRGSAPGQTTPEPLKTSPDFFLRIPSRDIDARAQQIDGEFTVFEGSIGAATVGRGAITESSTRTYNNIRNLHEKLVSDGSLRTNGDLAVFTRDVVFASPSAAGQVVTGRSCNGRTQWKTPTGLTFGAWEDGGDSASH